MNGSEGAKFLMHSQSTVDQPSDKLGDCNYQNESKNKKSILDQTEMIPKNQKTKLKRNKICINKKVRKTWTAQEDLQLQRSIQQHGSNWVQVAASMVNRNPSYSAIPPCLTYNVLRDGNESNHKLKRKPFSQEEDQLILQLVGKYQQNWGKIAQMFPERTNKQIRERYINKLNPLNKQEPFTEEEDQIILKAYQEIGSKWTKIQNLLVGRPENMIKNRFYSYLRQRFLNIKNPYYSIPSKPENPSIDQKLKVEKDEQLTEEKQLKEAEVQQINKEHYNQRNTDTLFNTNDDNAITTINCIQEMSTQLPLLQSDPYSQIPQPLFLGNFSYPQYYLYQAPGAIVYSSFYHSPLYMPCLQGPYAGFQKQIYMVQQDTNQLMHWSNS